MFRNILFIFLLILTLNCGRIHQNLYKNRRWLTKIAYYTTCKVTKPACDIKLL